jgi:Domain of unknown function (DUF4190)
MTSGGFGDDWGDTGPAGQPQYSQPQYSQSQYSQPGLHGQPPYGAPYGAVGRKTNALAIASLCCGIGQIVAWILASIPAIVLGFMALNEIRRTGEGGRGLAITGIVLGFVGIILMALLIIFFVAIIHGLSNNSATFRARPPGGYRGEP